MRVWLRNSLLAGGLAALVLWLFAAKPWSPGSTSNGQLGSTGTLASSAAGAEPASHAASSGDSVPAVPPLITALFAARNAGKAVPDELAPLEPADINQLSGADVEAAMNTLITDTGSYYDLGPDAQRLYDQLADRRRERLGMAPPAQRLERTKMVTP